MRQILHVFRKDVRRSWREAAVSMALLFVHGWNEVHSWYHEKPLEIWGFFASRFLSGLVIALVPIAWAFLFVRVIHAEPLVGDRQFWVTRPYEWKKLLAAKLLYALVFINIPMLVLQVYLLAKAGFNPLTYAFGLVWMQGLIAVSFLLPVAAVAVVTSSVIQVLLTTLVIAVYLIGMAVLSSQIPSSSFSFWVDGLQADIFIGAALAIVFLQYARRDTLKSRWLIGGLGVAIFLILVATPYRTLVEHEYPRTEAASPMQLTLLPGGASGEGPLPSRENDAEIQLPLSLSGIAPGTMVQVKGVLVEIEGPDGLRWDPGWNSPGLFLFPDAKATQIAFKLPKRMFERIRDLPVRIRLSFAFTLFRDTNQRAFVVPAGEFAMPGVGLCSTEGGYRQTIHCRVPLRRPTSLLVSADMSASTCPIAKGDLPADPGQMARNWTSSGDSDPAELGISPIQTVDFYLNYSNPSSQQIQPGICPASSLVLSNPKAVASNRTAVELDGVRVGDYQLKPVEIGGYGFAIRH